MSYKFVIDGGHTLSGRVRPSGNKNEALPALAASILSKETVTFRRMPKIGDVLAFCQILEELGARVEWGSDETLAVNCANLKPDLAPPKELCAKIRASILLLGPMLARFGHCELPLPGGDVIGARRIDTHFEGIEALGGTVQLEQSINAKISRLVGDEIFLDEPSVTATENIVILAALAEGTSIIRNAACEPHVVGLCNLLNAMGAKISGIGSNQLTIEGVTVLGGAEHTIGADFMEVGGYICLGAIGGGKITIEDADFCAFKNIKKQFGRIGIHYEECGNDIIVDGGAGLNISRDISGRVPTIYSGPWPAFPTDLMSVCIVAATQANGTAIFFEKMFESRMFFTDKLIAMGAQIILCDPHRVVVAGPAQLYGARLTSPDIRAGMSILMAALCAKGRSEILNIEQIERGYLNIEKKLQGLGASITRIRD